MNNSPFASWEEFEASTGAMYTFANSSSFMYLMVVVSAIITIYWLYTTFTIPAKHEEENTPN